MSVICNKRRVAGCDVDCPLSQFIELTKDTALPGATACSIFNLFPLRQRKSPHCIAVKDLPTVHVDMSMVDLSVPLCGRPHCIAVKDLPTVHVDMSMVDLSVPLCGRRHSLRVFKV